MADDTPRVNQACLFFLGFRQGENIRQLPAEPYSVSSDLRRECYQWRNCPAQLRKALN